MTGNNTRADGGENLDKNVFLPDSVFMASQRFRHSTQLLAKNIKVWLLMSYLYFES